MGTRADAIDDNTLKVRASPGCDFYSRFLCSRLHLARPPTEPLHLKIPSLDFQSASPAWACPSNLQAAKQGAAGALERIVLPRGPKIFVGDGNGLKILFADLVLSQPITHHSSLIARRLARLLSHHNSFRFPGPLYDVHTKHCFFACICYHNKSFCRLYSVQ